MKRFRFDKILYIILGSIFCVGGILLLPALTGWFDQILGIIAGTLLLIYLIVSSLFIKELNKVGKIISICELFVYLVLGVVSIISDVQEFEFLSACHLLAIALWLKGVCDVFRHIYSGDSNKKFTIKDGLFTIVLLTLGTAIFVKPLSDIALEYVISCFIIVLGVLLILLSVYLIRKDEPKESKETSKKNKKQKEEITEEVTPIEVEEETKEKIEEGNEVSKEENLETENDSEKE
ncbi:MAG: hypothetical protein ACI311_02615 [Bacilli bacterium]